MKKFVIYISAVVSLAVISLFTANADSSYTIKNVNITAEPQINGDASVMSEWTVEFGAGRSDGFECEIPIPSSPEYKFASVVNISADIDSASASLSEEASTDIDGGFADYTYTLSESDSAIKVKWNLKCFGETHVFRLSYTLSSVIKNIDSQNAFYCNYIPESLSPKCENVTITVKLPSDCTGKDAGLLTSNNYKCTRDKNSVTFTGESKITSAIYRLTSGEHKHAYYTTNHGEQEPTSSLLKALNAQNLEVEGLDLLTSEIPEDCDLLIIQNPATDFATGDSLVDEISMLRNYLNNGGSLLLTTDAYYSTPELDELMAEFGLSRTGGLVVEGDTDHALYNYAYYLLPDYTSTTESDALEGVDRSSHVLLQMAQGITITETPDVTAEALLTTSDKAYSKAAGYDMTTVEKEEGDAEGPFALAAWAQNEDTGAQVIWIGCSNMDNEQLYQSIPGNLTFLQGCAASLAGQSSSILIDTKALEATPITVPASAAMTLALIFVFVLPAAVLVAGVAVVLLRRRR